MLTRSSIYKPSFETKSTLAATRVLDDYLAGEPKPRPEDAVEFLYTFAWSDLTGDTSARNKLFPYERTGAYYIKTHTLDPPIRDSYPIMAMTQST